MVVDDHVPDDGRLLKNELHVTKGDQVEMIKQNYACPDWYLVRLTRPAPKLSGAKKNLTVTKKPVDDTIGYVPIRKLLLKNQYEPGSSRLRYVGEGLTKMYQQLLL